MTWQSTSIGRGRPAGVSDLEFLTRHTDLLQDGALRIVKSHSTARAFYAAVEAVTTTPEQSLGDVNAIVVTKQWSSTEFGWKVEHEAVNPEPIYADIALLDALTPTEGLLASIWRNRATEFASRPAAHLGDFIRLTTPKRFSDGVTRATFEIVGRGELLSLDDGRAVRLDDWREHEYVIVAVGAQAELPLSATGVATPGVAAA